MTVNDWDGTAVRAWLQIRIASAQADQVLAERRGREGQTECDVAAAEEMVCTLLRGQEEEGAFVEAVKAVLDSDEYVWRGVYDERRFDRYVRTYCRKLLRMARTREGFQKLGRYQ